MRSPANIYLVARVAYRISMSTGEVFDANIPNNFGGFGSLLDDISDRFGDRSQARRAKIDASGATSSGGTVGDGLRFHIVRIPDEDIIYQTESSKQ